LVISSRPVKETRADTSPLAAMPATLELSASNLAIA
jgi:hypothetical protein